MLRGLDIRDMLIIDRLELAFQPGLNVLTGETGAGKSILLDALGFVLGWRGRAELVRAGAAQGEVTAVFDLPAGHPAREVLAEAGLPERGRVDPAPGERRRRAQDRLGERPPRDRRGAARAVRHAGRTAWPARRPRAAQPARPPRPARRLRRHRATARGDPRGLGRPRRRAPRRWMRPRRALAAVRAEEDYPAPCGGRARHARSRTRRGGRARRPPPADAGGRADPRGHRPRPCRARPARGPKGR